jgi:hypothetical protein
MGVRKWSASNDDEEELSPSSPPRVGVHRGVGSALDKETECVLLLLCVPFLCSCSGPLHARHHQHCER